MLNKVILQGNIGRAPKIALTQEGKKMVTFSLATTQSWKDLTGEWQSTTDWHQVTIFRESTIGWAKDVLKRGDPVYVEGKLSYHRWTDNHGQQRSTTHVVIAGREGRVQILLPRSPTPPRPSNLNLQVQPISSAEDLSSDPEPIAGESVLNRSVSGDPSSNSSVSSSSVSDSPAEYFQEETQIVPHYPSSEEEEE